MEIMYLFDSRQQVRAAIADGVTECIHHEHSYSLDATIPAEYNPRPGEYLGLCCVDGRWRLFCVTEAETDDAKGLCTVEATDAAVDDLQHIIIKDKLQKDITAEAAAANLLDGTDWDLGAVTTDNTTNTTDAQWVNLWTAMETLAKVFKARVTPYYVIEGGEVKAKKIDLKKDEATFRGRIYESQADAHNVKITYTQRPITVLYGLGKATEQESKTSVEDGAKQNVDFADVVWSKDNGDPADKPAGQQWVEDVEATALYGRRENIYTANDIDDPAELLKATWEELQDKKAPKVTVSGTIQDMEQLAGEEWRTVRLGDLVALGTLADGVMTTRVIKIDRDYIKTEQTKLTTGEELQTVTSKISGLIRANQYTQETITIYRNKFHSDKALILLNADLIMAQGKEIDLHANDILTLRQGVDDNAASITLADGKITENAKQIELHGKELVTIQAGVNDNAARITVTEDKIEEQANEIVLKASNKDLNDLETTVTISNDGVRQAIQDGDKTIAELNSTVNGLEHWVTDADGNISTLTNTVRGMESKVESASGQVSTLTNTAEGMTSTIQGQGEALSQLKTRIDEISATVKDVDGNVGSLVVKSDSITGKLKDASGKITALVEATNEHWTSLQGDIYEVDGKVTVIQGSAIWQTRDNITAAVGTMYVDADGKLHIRDGSGLVVDRGSASLGVYDAGNLTAGVLVQKLNDGSTTTKIKADVINLEGYVTASELSAEYLTAEEINATYASIQKLDTIETNVSNLTSGLTTALVLNANTINGSQVNGAYGNFDVINHNGELVSQRDITMGDVGTVGKALSVGGELNLQHSHKVTVNDDGTITLGEVSTDGGNFRIADTKVYKDAVSAAASKVNFTGYTLSGGVLTVNLSNDKSQTYYSGASVSVDDKSATVTLADNNSMSGAATLRTVDVSSVYNGGWNDALDACTKVTRYTISETPTSTLYIQVNGQYTSAGTGWVKVTRNDAYNLPDKK